jgi:chemotaxis protein histidine kinase CheA
MNDELPFDQSTLSAEDLATLRAFDAIEGWETAPSDPTTPSSVRESSASYPESDDTLPIFFEEVEEDISSMLEALQKIEQEGSPQPSHFAALRRLGHKMRGTAGAMGYLNMSEIASSVEVIAEQVTYHMLQPATGSKAIFSAVNVLESCLYRLAQDGQEQADAMADLRSFYTQLSIDLDQPIHEALSPPVHLQSSVQSKTEASDQALLPASDQILSTPPLSIQLPVELPTPYTSTHSQVPSEPSSRPTAAHADMHQFDTLICHSEKLLAQHAAIEHAHQQVEMAFQGLQAAQDRFQHAETLFSISLTQNYSSHLPKDFTSSSLITRIFDTAPSRDLAHSRQSKGGGTHTQSTRPPRSSTWDELDIERYTEQDMLLLSLREATANVDICSTHLKHAYHALQKLQQEYMMQVTSVRNDVLLMRMAPFSTTVAQVREVVINSTLAKEHQVDFEVTGDEVEVDRELLASLTPLLVNMLQASIDNATPAPATKQPSSSPQSDHIWLHARALNNEIALEVGFSMPVNGGTLQTLRKQLRRLYGSVSPARNAAGGISFFLRFPRFPGLLRCLVVRVADQKLLIPLSHVHHVGYIGQAMDNSFYSLSSLLNLPASSTPSLSQATMQQVVFLHIPGAYTQREPVEVMVDEIIDETELIVRPLASHLERSGITGSAIDGQGDVLLLLDVAELLYTKQTGESFQQRTLTQPAKILVAEDSTTVRNSLIQTLSRTPYQVTEARDGLEALEALKSGIDTPDILLLDIEMPFLTGYDLLDILRRDLRFSNMKVIMLTSRTSERHQQHAIELGAHAYLTKPSSPEELLNTIQRLLFSERPTS